jgi:hypothetical protein
MLTYTILQKSSFLILIVWILSFFHKVNHWIFYLLQLSLAGLFISSCLFWNNQIKQSNYHKIDAIIVRITLILSIVYTLLFNTPSTMFLCMYFIVLCFLILSFLASTYYSNLYWCSEKHIFYHLFLHYYGWLIGLYAIV